MKNIMFFFNSSSYNKVLGIKIFKNFLIKSQKYEKKKLDFIFFPKLTFFNMDICLYITQMESKQSHNAHIIYIIVTF